MLPFRQKTIDGTAIKANCHHAEALVMSPSVFKPEVERSGVESPDSRLPTLRIRSSSWYFTWFSWRQYAEHWSADEDGEGQVVGCMHIEFEQLFVEPLASGCRLRIWSSETEHGPRCSIRTLGSLNRRLPIAVSLFRLARTRS